MVPDATYELARFSFCYVPFQLLIGYTGFIGNKIKVCVESTKSKISIFESKSIVAIRKIYRLISYNLLVTSRNRCLLSNVSRHNTGLTSTSGVMHSKIYTVESCLTRNSVHEDIVHNYFIYQKVHIVL